MRRVVAWVVLWVLCGVPTYFMVRHYHFKRGTWTVAARTEAMIVSGILGPIGLVAIGGVSVCEWPGWQRPASW